ncbi:phosphoethanolamine transferase CptA [Methylotenera sp. L2L1]|uniref:phosphoethanolamine transferase CptA n=1 Tax=Methylotenera sp. L2L1 TaxID=1502770 RepID=UPI00055AEC05|nr:phosphoethanolamine transferase CptA [Methylotenera sp. L2L1]
MTKQNWRAFFILYIFFLYFSGITHLLLQVTDATIFVGLRQAIYMSFLWMIPVLLFPNKTKEITGAVGLMLWASSLVSLGYFCIYQQEFSQSVIFIIFESNLAESSEFIAQYFKWWMLPILIGHTIISYLLWRQVKPVTFPLKNAVFISLFILTFLFGAPLFKSLIVKKAPWNQVVYIIEKHMQPAQPWQLIIGYVHYREQLATMEAMLEKNKSLPPVKNLKDKHGELNSTMVLVIGESTNRQHMSLYGYNRPTTPQLDAMKNELSVFQHAVSSRPSTIESLEQILTFADQNNPDLFLTKPTLMNIMKQAGYKTYWITNQQTITKRNTMLTNFSKQMDVQYYMNNSSAQNSREYDENVLEPLQKSLDDNAPKKFIVVHLLGTHMKYKYRYPDKFAKFDSAEGTKKGLSQDKIDIINTYDNAILYNDYVVSSIKKMIEAKQERSFMAYLSDHGEDVYDTPPHDFLGRNEGNPSLAMYATPLIMWASPAWKEKSAINLNGHLDAPYSLSNFIHTWFDVAGLSFDDLDINKSLVNSSFKQSPVLIGDPRGSAGLKTLAQ